MTLCLEDRPAPKSLRRLLQDFGFVDTEAELFSIAREKASVTIAHLVAYNLAYGQPTGLLDIADECGREFVALFPDNCIFFTNSAEPISVSTRSWLPLTKATFYSGVLAISSTKTGVLWFEEED